MTLRGSLVTKCALAYLGAPTIIFLFGWLRWEIGVPAALLAGTALVCAFRRNGAGESLEPLSEPAEELRISPWVALALVGCIVIWCIMAGQGGFVVQTNDWNWRNATFRDMITHEWPVRYDAWNRALVFYVGHWLPSAIVGKLALAATGDLAMAWRIGNLALLAWTAFGVTLALAQLLQLLKAHSALRQLAVLLLLVFWGGCDAFGTTMLNAKRILAGASADGLWWKFGSWWFDRYYQFSPNSTCLYWVFHQAVPAWVAILLVARGAQLSTIALIASFALICGPLPGIGIAFFVAVLVGRQMFERVRDGRWRIAVSDALSFQNMTGVFVVFPAVALFFFSNSQSAQFSSAWSEKGVGWFASRTALFLACVVGPYAVLTFRRFRKSVWWWCVLVWSCVCPAIRIGGEADFCMRASIPAMMCLSALCFLSVSDYLLRRSKLAWVLLGFMIMGTFVPCREMSLYLRRLSATGPGVVEADRIVTFDQDLEAKFLNEKGYWPGIGDWITSKCNIKSPDDAFFYRHMAKRRRTDAARKEAGRQVDERSGR